MDDIVKAALSKWPNVPDCYGWLGLDARGQWYMRDDRAQAAGPFVNPDATPQLRTASKGSLLRHDKLIEFIGRNYEADDSGRWYFQNGPQRVYVELEITPRIWRLQADFSLLDHCGRAARARACLLDEAGRLYLDTDLGFGLLHTQDVLLASEAIEQGLWAPQACDSAALPARYGYVLSPAQGQHPVGAAP